MSIKYRTIQKCVSDRPVSCNALAYFVRVIAESVQTNFDAWTNEQRIDFNIPFDAVLTQKARFTS